MNVIVQFPNEKPIAVKGHVAAVIRRLLLAAELIEKAAPLRLTIHIGKDVDDVSVEVPVRY